MFNTRVITCALAISGVLLIGSQVSDRQSRAQGGPPGGLNVTVCNTPLPVTVTNPTVPPSTVNVGNPAALAAANAQALAGTPAAFTIDSFAPRTSFSVPVGKRFVIEYVSGVCEEHPLTGISATTNGVDQRYFFSVPVPPSQNTSPSLPLTTL